MLRVFLIVILSLICAAGCMNEDNKEININNKISSLKFEQNNAKNVDYKDYYEISSPIDWKIKTLPNLKNAFNLYPGNKIRHLYNNCTLQVITDLYEIVPTQKRFEILLNEAYIRSRTFIKTTTVNEKDLAVSARSSLNFNNLKGASFNITSLDPNRFFESVHYFFVNPDDIGVVYASAIALKKETSNECLELCEKALSTLKYAPKKESY